MPVVGSKGEIFGTIDGAFPFQPTDLKLTQVMIDKDKFIANILFNNGRTPLDCIILNPKKIFNNETIDEFQTRVLTNFSTIIVEKLGGSEETIDVSTISSFSELTSLLNSDPLIVKESSITTQGRNISHITIEFKDVGCVEIQYVTIKSDENEIKFPKYIISSDEPKIFKILGEHLNNIDNYSKIIVRQKYGGGRVVINYLAKSLTI